MPDPSQTAPQSPARVTTTDRNADRYARQTLFAGIGRAGQERLLTSRVAIIGCGALGTVLANNLARAGVGHLTIADRDFIEANNLQRQVLFDEDDLARNLPKAIAAVERLRRINARSRSPRWPKTSTPKTLKRLSPASIWSWMAPTTSRRATCLTTPASKRANPGSTAA